MQGVRAPPQRQRDRFGVDIAFAPPPPLVAPPMQFAMKAAAQRHGEFVADLAPERARLDDAVLL
jgi:hypothetical protein